MRHADVALLRNRGIVLTVMVEGIGYGKILKQKQSIACLEVEQ